MSKRLIGMGLFAGSAIGSDAPALWVGSLLSPSSILFGGIGGLIVIWLDYRLTKYSGFL